MARQKRHYIYVAAYHVGQVYGGPEEGGWWYDAGYPLKWIRLPHTASRACIARAKEKLRALFTESHAAGVNGRPEYTSVLSEGDLGIYVDRAKPAPFPKYRPHYE